MWADCSSLPTNTNSNSNRLANCVWTDCSSLSTGGGSNGKKGWAHFRELYSTVTEPWARGAEGRGEVRRLGRWVQSVLAGSVVPHQRHQQSRRGEASGAGEKGKQLKADDSVNFLAGLNSDDLAELGF